MTPEMHDRVNARVKGIEKLLVEEKGTLQLPRIEKLEQKPCMGAIGYSNGVGEGLDAALPVFDDTGTEFGQAVANLTKHQK